MRLLREGGSVLGIDNLNPYYDVELKKSRLSLLFEEKEFKFVELDLTNREGVDQVFLEEDIDNIVHLAAQAGVRYSITNPQAYIDSNITGLLNTLENAKTAEINHFVFASTSSVYGLNTDMPFSPHKGANHPLSLYATTKRAGELIGHNYATLFDIPFTAVRFFTVYGPWGRPDMALFLFTRRILEGKSIDVFNHGDHMRDFTYVDDIVDGLEKIVDSPPKDDVNWDSSLADPASSSSPFKIYNLGSSNPTPLNTYIEALERKLGMKAKKNLLPLQPGDVPGTYADISDTQSDFGFQPKTRVEAGIDQFVDWYRWYYRV